MTRRLAILAALAACLALPGVASAHTGQVSCTTSPTDATKTGVTFTYQANFAHDTTVTENVNGVTTTFLVHANTATSHTLPAPASSVIAGATWSDGTQAGSIPFTSLTNCTPKPVTAPAVCVPTTVSVPGPATVEYITGPGATQYVDRVKTRIVYRTRIKWKTRIKLIVAKPFKPLHKVHAGFGVTG